MAYNTVAVNTADRYMVGVEDKTGKYYVGFPVFNGLAEYTEYYEIDQPTFERYRADIESARDFVAACRRHEMDHLLIQKPGRIRGTPI
jgi:hypothetical protein